MRKPLIVFALLLLACPEAMAQRNSRFEQIVDARDVRIRELERQVEDQAARIRELEAKVPSAPVTPTQVRLAAGSLFGQRVAPNALCKYCGALLMIGEVKELMNDINTPLSKTPGKPVACPRCQEDIEPFEAKHRFNNARKAAQQRAW